MDHIAHECRCHKPMCVYCSGGLFSCDVCGSAEGATTTDCPGERMTPEQMDAVYAGTLDFREAAGWVEKASRHSPSCRREKRGAN